MIIKISDVPTYGITYDGEDPASVMDLDNEADLRPDGPLEYHLHAQYVSDRLIVRGTLVLPVSFRCSRCAEFFSRRVREPDFEFVKEAARSESVDLTADMREAMILAFPHYPMCKNDCRGLCALCGSNLNRKKCGCRPREQTAWAALDKLNIK